MHCIAIYGASGLGREIMPLMRQQYAGAGVSFIYVDDGIANGRNILTFDAFVMRPEPRKSCILAIANSMVREKLEALCRAADVAIIGVSASNVVVLDNVKIGEGAVLCNFVHLTSDIRIGRQFHANFYAYVAHDCVIGDFVTFAPGAKCNGNVHIDDHAYIGSGAILKQGTPDKPLRIGRGALVGMGAVVTKDVPAGETWIGNPARPLRRN